MNIDTPTAEVILQFAAWCIFVTAIFLAREAWWAHDRRRYVKRLTAWRAINHDRIDALADLRMKLEELDRERNPRHRLRCALCGRLARQAGGMPEGVTECAVHGVVAVAPTWTGPVPILVQSVGGLTPIEAP